MIMERAPDGIKEEQKVTRSVRLSRMSEDYDSMLNEDIESDELKFEDKKDRLEPRSSLFEEVLFGVLCDIFPETEVELKIILENCDNRLINAAKLIVEKAFERKIQLAQKTGKDTDNLFKYTVIDVITWDMSEVEKQVVDSFVCEFGGDIMDAICCILEGTDYLAAIYDKFPQDAQWMKEVVTKCHCAFRYMPYSPECPTGATDLPRESVADKMVDKGPQDFKKSSLVQKGDKGVPQASTVVKKNLPKGSSSSIKITSRATSSSSSSNIHKHSKYQQKRKDSVIKHPPSRLTSVLKKPSNISNTGQVPAIHTKEQSDFTAKLKVNYNLKAIHKRIAELQTIKEVNKREESPTLKMLRQGANPQKVLAAATEFEQKARTSVFDNRSKEKMAHRRKKMMENFVMPGLTPIEDASIEQGTSSEQPLQGPSKVGNLRKGDVEVKNDILKIFSRYFPNHERMKSLLPKVKSETSVAAKINYNLSVTPLDGRESVEGADALAICHYIVQQLRKTPESTPLGSTTPVPGFIEATKIPSLTLSVYVSPSPQDTTKMFLNSMTEDDRKLMKSYLDSCGGSLYDGVVRIMRQPKSMNVVLNMADIIKENEFRASTIKNPQKMG